MKRIIIGAIVIVVILMSGCSSNDIRTDSTLDFYCDSEKIDFLQVNGDRIDINNQSFYVICDFEDYFKSSDFYVEKHTIIIPDNHEERFLVHIHNYREYEDGVIIGDAPYVEKYTKHLLLFIHKDTRHEMYPYTLFLNLVDYIGDTQIKIKLTENDLNYE